MTDRTKRDNLRIRLFFESAPTMAFVNDHLGNGTVFRECANHGSVND